MQITPYSDLLNERNGFDEWLRDLGIRPRNNDRIHKAFDILRIADAATQKGRETGHYSPIQAEHLFPLIEALEAIDVLHAFRTERSPALAKAVKRALHGPGNPSEEHDEASRDARNIWFELALAAEWRLRGSRVELGEPDLQLIHNHTKFLIACKRPVRDHAIQANIRGAISQLDKELQSATGHIFGVIAISLTRVFTEGAKYWTGTGKELSSLLYRVTRTHIASLRESYSDPRICAILFHVATPSDLGREVDVSLTSQLIGEPVHRSAGTLLLKERLEAMVSVEGSHSVRGQLDF